MKTMMRVWFREQRKSLLFVQPPFPAVGQVLNAPDGKRLTVIKIHPEEGIEVKFPARAAKEQR